ncbi:aldo/keto reductase [Bosea sp. UC22_33]|uniref:aldo/keto reductase n=1 Tax=Bosea sp. UC22_33 TaxID=3350165 RepID=UPI003671FA48
MANAAAPSFPVPPGRPFAGLSPSLIGFGGAPLGDLYGHLDEVTAQDTVRAALAAGINLLDTSPLYGHGLSEHRIGAALRSVPRESVILSTKVGRWMQAGAPKGDGSGYAGGLPHPAVVDYSYDGAMRSFEQSLLRLGTDHIDILLIHDVDVGPMATGWSNASPRPWMAPIEPLRRCVRPARSRRSASASTKPRCACGLPAPAIST